MTVEGSSAPSTENKAKTEAPGKEPAACTNCWEAVTTKKAGKGDGLYYKLGRVTGPKATIFRSVIRLSNSSRSRGLSTRSVVRRKTKMTFAGRAKAVE